MKIILLQQDIAWGKPIQNRINAEKAIFEHPGGDLYLLPEMFNTGFSIHPQELAEPADGETFHWMTRLSATTNAAIVGSMMVVENGNFYNRMFFVSPGGNTAYYNKRHLFSYGDEDKHFTSGRERIVVSFRGIRFLMQICYDLRFPVFSRNLKDYDAILYVANWPTSRLQVWKTLLRARAIENQCFVVGVNRTGNDPTCNYPGASAIIDAYGRTLAECQTNSEDTVSAEIDLEWLQAFRKKFPVLEDRDVFNLKV